MVLKYDDAFETTTSGIGKGMEGLLIGSPFMGCIIDALLLGVIFCQITHWLPNIRYDPRHVCIVVGWAVVAAVGGTIYSWVHWMDAIVYHFGSYSRFFAIDSMGWYGLLDGLVVVPVQLVFIERAVRINGNSCIIGAVTILLTIATGALGMTFLIMTRGHSVMSVPDSAVVVSACWPAVCTMTHITITGCIIYGLHKSRSGTKSADKLISRLMSVSIESQLPSSVVAVILLAVIVSDPRSPFIPFIAIVHPKVFLIGMLAMINLRHSWRNSGKTPSQYESSHGAVSRKSAGGAPGLSSRGTTHEGSSLDTPRFGSPRTDEIRPYSSSGRLAPGIEDECGMVELEQKNVSKEDLESGINPFHY